MDTNNSFVPAGPAHDFVKGPAPCSVASSASDSITGPTHGFVADLATDFVTSPAPGIVASRVAPIMIDLIKSNYFYRKQVMAEDLTSSKLYMKRTIWIKGI